MCNKTVWIIFWTIAALTIGVACNFYILKTIAPTKTEAGFPAHWKEFIPALCLCVALNFLVTSFVARLLKVCETYFVIRHEDSELEIAETNQLEADEPLQNYIERLMDNAPDVPRDDEEHPHNE